MSGLEHKIKNRAERLGKLLLVRAPSIILRNELRMLFNAGLQHVMELKDKPKNEDSMAWLKGILDND